MRSVVPSIGLRRCASVPNSVTKGDGKVRFGNVVSPIGVRFGSVVPLRGYASVPITVAKGDGIGPEITDATMRILEAANARISPEFVSVGEQEYLKGVTSGIGEDTWASMTRTKVMLKVGCRFLFFSSHNRPHHTHTHKPTGPNYHPSW